MGDWGMKWQYGCITVIWDSFYDIKGLKAKPFIYILVEYYHFDDNVSRVSFFTWVSLNFVIIYLNLTKLKFNSQQAI